jgi:putative proteasome-type protease
MTYCLGIITKAGLVMAADSRTNAGVDYVSTARKLFEFSRPGERVILIATAGNLSITQSVINEIREDLKHGVAGNIHGQDTLYHVADYLGNKIRLVGDKNRQRLEQDGISASCSFLLGGQLANEPPELFMIYSQGNFLQATPETPYLQIGEIKYGKPILDRIIRFNDSSLDECAKCALLSLDSTMKSNISVGPPIYLTLYPANHYKIERRMQFPLGDPYLLNLRKSWEDSLKHAFQDLPTLEWNAYEVEALGEIPGEPEANWAMF